MLFTDIGPVMALDKQCPIIDWSCGHLDFVLTEQDQQFAREQNYSDEQLKMILCTFEKTVNFNSASLSFHDMRQRIARHLPKFEENLHDMRSKGKDVPSSQTEEDRELVLQVTFQYWQNARRSAESALLRPFWKRYQMDDNDQDGIFRSRYAEKMKLRKKTRVEADSLLKFKQLLVSGTRTLEQCHNVVRREHCKRLFDMHQSVRFE